MALTFDFTLEGFRTIRERPKLILFWGATLLFGNGLGGLVLVAFSGPAMATLMSIGAKPVEDAFRISLLREMLPGIGAWLPIHLLTMAVINGAICRAGLGDGDDRFGFLEFGLCELRILAVMAAKLIMTSAIVFVAVMVAEAGALADAASAQGLLSAGLLAAICAVVWLEVRLSLNVPQSFAARRVDIFGSFVLTRGLFWRLFWGYCASTGLALCVAFLCGKIIEAIQGIAFGEHAATTLPDMTSLQTYLTLETITYECVSNALVVPLLLAILLGAPVAAYRALAPFPGPEKKA